MVATAGILAVTGMIMAIVLIISVSRAIGRRGAGRRELRELRQDISQIKGDISDMKEQLADIIIRLD